MVCSGVGANETSDIVVICVDNAMDAIYILHNNIIITMGY